MHTEGLPSDEAYAVGEHLAGCAWCRAKVAQYDALHAALRRHYDPDAMIAPVVAPIPSVGVIAARSARPAHPTPERLAAPRWSVGRPRARLPLSLGTVAALLVIALFGVVLGWQRGVGAGSTPTLDPQAQAYVEVLHADYLPLLDALGADRRQCIAAYESAPAADKPQALSACKPVETNVVTASQTLLADLAATPTPSRWRSADAQLNAWAQALIAIYTHRIQAIDAHNTTQFVALVDAEIDPAAGRSCAPIQRINAELPPGSQLPLSASGSC
jgi:hypothetical protein